MAIPYFQDKPMCSVFPPGGFWDDVHMANCRHSFQAVPSHRTDDLPPCPEMECIMQPCSPSGCHNLPTRPRQRTQVQQLKTHQSVPDPAANLEPDLPPSYMSFILAGAIKSIRFPYYSHSIPIYSHIIPILFPYDSYILPMLYPYDSHFLSI